jgi:FkbM family methyltransferase
MFYTSGQLHSLAFVRGLVKWAIHRPAKWALYRTGCYGVDAFADIKRLSRTWQYPIEVFFDVGANDGGTTKRAEHNFRDCQIIAFEPHPKTFEQLRKSASKFPNVELFNLALGSEPGQETMFEYDTLGSTINSLLPNRPYPARYGLNISGQILVNCTTIDRFCSERGIKKIDILKIDTEGFDFEVLKGAVKMLSDQAIKFIFFELLDIDDGSDGRLGGALKPIDELIRPYGYRFIATYLDFVITSGELLLCSNALYALPPSRRLG